MSMKNIKKIVVVGLGYVGLPLAAAFSHHFEVIGYDLSEEKIGLYQKGIDPTNELGSDGLKDSAIPVSYTHLTLPTILLV